MSRRPTCGASPACRRPAQYVAQTAPRQALRGYPDIAGPEALVGLPDTVYRILPLP
ncbi:hypothetical protein ACU4GD_16395 [Cupriavidus basilensis]